MDIKDIRRILVIKLRHIGDVLLSVPVFRALRENFPDARLTALVNSGTEEVLTGNPLIDELIVFDRGIKKMNPVQKYLKELSFLKMIRAKGFDMAVDLTSGDRAAIISFVSGARYRFAYDPGRDGFPGKRYLYTHLAQKDGSQHMVLQNLDIIRQFGISTENLDVDIHIPEEAREFVKKFFEEHNINKIPPHSPLMNLPAANGGVSNISPPLTGGDEGEGEATEITPTLTLPHQGGGNKLKPCSRQGITKLNDKVVHVHPTSRWLFKCWKDEYMAEVIKWLLEQGVNVIVTSSPDNRELNKAKRILSLVPSRLTPHASRLIDLCGKTTIKQLAAISEASDLFLGIDSAPMHIATAVGTPVIALFGPTGDTQWGPWGKNHRVFSKDMECKPCQKGVCDKYEIRRCLEKITKEEIIDALSSALKLKSDFI